MDICDLFSVSLSKVFHLYSERFENSDGQIRHESGDVRDEKEGGIFVVGQYSYVGTDNKLYTVRYEAGKDGYKPTLTVTDL